VRFPRDHTSSAKGRDRIISELSEHPLHNGALVLLEAARQRPRELVADNDHVTWLMQRRITDADDLQDCSAQRRGRRYHRRTCCSQGHPVQHTGDIGPSAAEANELVARPASPG
jgi:hypothetical protein